MCLQATVCLAVTSLPAPLAIKGLARNRQDVRLTDPGRSCEKSAASDHWPVNRCSQSVQSMGQSMGQSKASWFLSNIS